MKTSVIAANDLKTGQVVYLCGSGAFSPWLANAAVAETESAANSLMALAEIAARQNRIVGPTFREVAFDSGGPRPLSMREHIRATGPTVGPSPSPQT